MGRYLKAAFLATLHLPLLGNIPVNLFAFAGCMILGFGHPGFWLLGLGLETAYLFSLATNARFRRAIDTQVEVQSLQSGEAKRRILIEKLNSAARKKFDAAEGKSRRILQTLRDHEAEEFVILGNVEALNKLMLVYIKLLFGRTILESAGSTSTPDGALQDQADSLRRDSSDESVPISVRQSKRATLEILEKRIENVARRKQTMREIESDLERIEAQLDLGLENAAIRSREQAVDFDLDLASQLMDTSIFGDSVSDFADVDALYEMPRKEEESSSEKRDQANRVRE